VILILDFEFKIFVIRWNLLNPQFDDDKSLCFAFSLYFSSAFIGGFLKIYNQLNSDPILGLAILFLIITIIGQAIEWS